MYDKGIEGGTGRHRAPTRDFVTPLTPPDPTWDPAEELAFILEEALGEHRQGHGEQGQTRGGYGQVRGEYGQSRGEYGQVRGEHGQVRGEHGQSRGEYGQVREEYGRVRDEEPGPRIPAPRDEARAGAADVAPDGHMRRLQDITEELPPVRDLPRRHRKVRTRKAPGLLRTTSFLVAAMAAVAASAVSLLSGMVAYDPLRLVAVSPAATGLRAWWPLLVYGPWLVASLSVLRAALHQRRAVHSWCVVLVFSCVAVLLCVAQAPRTVLGTVAAALPGLAALACFQQVVRQITLTRPPVRTVPRHRVGQTPPKEPAGGEIPGGGATGQGDGPQRGAGA
ncbi:hypothetical protein [Streptomyces djakartensis]|uniref:DUF2637 domain-containing protein n=1 Tax=Streptomyces djakartensis TaxID=68193 RepID=A0ABQ3AEF5_9ACTN|nr:hypothetical protein [Streptomyces djakartensis]GGY49751.1 hypothetical protein GCM10010384_64870 [Streptomyces djakartensis]